MPDLTERAREAYAMVQAAEEAAREEDRRLARQRREAADRSYALLREHVADELLARFGVGPALLTVREMVACNGVQTTDAPDALVVNADGVDLIVGDCRALAAGTGDFSVHLTERATDTASGYTYWSARSSDLTDLAALGRALTNRGDADV